MSAGVSRAKLMMVKALAPLVLLGSAVACTGEGPVSGVSIERFRYNSEQRSPIAATISGLLTVTQRSADRFDGTLDALQTYPNGQVERRAGIVRGRTSASAMDFDVMLEGDVYRHVGRAVADTVAGSWLDVSAIGNAASGTFRLERAP